jgi:hypothetical protein
MTMTNEEYINELCRQSHAKSPKLDIEAAAKAAETNAPKIVADLAAIAAREAKKRKKLKMKNEFIRESRRCETCSEWKAYVCDCGSMHFNSGDCKLWKETTKHTQVCVYYRDNR